MSKQVIDSDSPDQFLLMELKRGNSKAFDLIFNKYYNTLCRFAYTQVQDGDIPQGLVQNVFLKLWERRFILGEIKNLAGYLVTMVKNQIYDYLKEQQLLNIDTKTWETIADNSTEQEILSRNFEEQLVLSIAKLPPRCRIAFEFSRFENMSNKEIASKMDISVKGVEALIGRSLKSLRVDLREFLPSFDLKNVNPILLFFRTTRKIWSGIRNT